MIDPADKELQAKLAAQKKLQEDKGHPAFAPHDGICWSCKRQIYTKISLDRAGKELITGCPHCARSYCD